MIFGKKNQRETVPEVAMRQGPRPLQVGAPPPSWAPRKAVEALLCPQEIYFLEKDLGEGVNPIGVTDLHIYTKR